MIRIGNRVMDVYISGEWSPRNRGFVQSSTNNTDKAVRENRDTVQIHDSRIRDNIDTAKQAYDISLKSTHCDMEHIYTYYCQELEREAGNYMHNVVQSQGYYGFDDIGMATAYAYSVLYQQIVEGHRNGTRELYVYDSTIGERRLLTLEEELQKLDQGYESLIEWDVSCAKSRYSVEMLNEKLNNKELDDLYHIYDGDQAGSYIRKSYRKFRSRFLNEYEKNNGEADVKSLFMSVLKDGNQSVHDFCKLLFGKTMARS